VSDPALPRRLPGGTLLDGERPLVGLYRELQEETGLEGLIVVRKLGVQSYYKPYIARDVERHDYLLRAPDGLPAQFVHTVSGGGSDVGEVFQFKWIGPDEIDKVDDEFQRDLTLRYLPELFSRPDADVGVPRNRETEQVVIVEYDQSWPRLYEERRTLLREVFGEDAQVEHIGSTAVPGLGAKPIIDIMIGLSELSQAEERIGQLAWLGYEYVPESEADVPERRYFRQYSNGRRAVHLHCVLRGSVDWTRALAFRDVLRTDRDAANDYLLLKKSLAAEYRSDRYRYSEAKGSFVEAVLRSRATA
jgi:GrpB-like predicted nucleotidyltransferase (UPF0157 family)